MIKYRILPELQDGREMLHVQIQNIEMKWVDFVIGSRHNAYYDASQSSVIVNDIRRAYPGAEEETLTFYGIVSDLKKARQLHEDALNKLESLYRLEQLHDFQALRKATDHYTALIAYYESK